MKAYLLILLVLTTTALPTLEAAPEDARSEWRVGIAAFEGTDLNPENLYLTRSFPLLLRERLEAIPSHFYGSGEAQAYRRRIIREEQQRLTRAVAADRRARDELFFTSGDSGAQASVYEQRIGENLEAIRELGDLDPARIQLPESKPLRFAAGSDGQLIFDTVVYSPLQLAEQQDLDALIWGRIEEIQGFLYVEIFLFNTALEQEVFSYSDAVGATELYDTTDALIAELATSLLGRDWSALTVISEPPGASIWIDGAFRGRSPLEIPFLLPGTRELRVEVDGYLPLVETIDLPPLGKRIRNITLEIGPGQSYTLNSDPQGAEVYSGSRWLGSTPLSVQRSEEDELRRLMLRREGFLDFPLYVDPAVQPDEPVSVELLPDRRDPQALQNRRREELYRAFGAFALSVPLPLILWGFGTDYYVLSLDSNLSSSESQEALAKARTLTGVSLGTMAVSSGLLVNLVVRLVRYLRAADRKA